MTGNVNSAPHSGKLRFGIMCSGTELPAAHAKCVEGLLSIPGLELALLIVDASPVIRKNAWQKAKTILSFKHSAWQLYACASRVPRLACYRPVDMSRIYAPVPSVHCRTIREGTSSEYFLLEDIEVIREYNLDFILQFAFGIIRGDILQGATYGLWSFHYGDEMKFRGGPPAFWEIHQDEPVTGAILQRLTHRLSGGVILQKGFIQTKKFSYGANLNAVVWAATYMPGRVCRDIFQGRAQYLNAPPSQTDAPISHTPNNIEMARFFFKGATRWLRRLTSILYSEDWNIGVIEQPIHNFLDSDYRPRVKWLAYKRPHYYIADPFLLKIGSKLKLLAEEFDWRSGRGYIVETDLRDQSGALLFRKVLDEGIHMSYPYLFEHEERYYCIPEASQRRNVSLYAFDAERDLWSQEAVLIPDFAGVDPTLIQHGDRWWLFCTDLDDETDSKLFVWHAPKLLGPWEPHSANPVKMDVRSSRPAGRPFFFEGRMYRPAQDCSLTYGGAITINRLTRLTTQEFSEEAVAHIQPMRKSPYRVGIHTVVGHNMITVIDGKRWVFTPALALQRIEYKVRQILGQKRG